MKSKIVALSAISTAFVAIFLSLGSYVQIADVFCLLIASTFSLAPLCKGNYKAGFISYICGATLATLFSLPTFAFTFVVPAYLVFFGVFPLVYHLLKDKKVNAVLRYIIGLLWCVASFYGVYFYYTAILGLTITDLPEFISNGILYFIPLYALIFYVIYERFVIVIRKVVDRYLIKYIHE